MRLVKAIVGMMASQFAAAQLCEPWLTSGDTSGCAVHIPYDCYQETLEPYGNYISSDTKVSDRDLISGLDITTDKLSGIATCTDPRTGIVTGITTTWGQWDSANSVWTNQKRLNIVGRLSGLQHYDDLSPLASLGISSLSTDLDFALMEYWYQEASPAQEDGYIQRATLWALPGTTNRADFVSDRTTKFNTADMDSDGFLNQTEYKTFLEAARPLDFKTDESDRFDQRINMQWEVLRRLTPATNLTMSIADYILLEDIMTAWYQNGKLQATGHARSRTSTSVGSDLSHQCKLTTFAHDDRVNFIKIASSPQGIIQINLQTKFQMDVALNGAQLSDSSPGVYNSRYYYVEENWENFNSTSRDFYGFWGTTDANGDLNSLGFIAKDLTCISGFSSLGSSLSWTSVVPGTAKTLPTFASRYPALQTFLDDKSNPLPTYPAVTLAANPALNTPAPKTAPQALPAYVDPTATAASTLPQTGSISNTDGLSSTVDTTAAGTQTEEDDHDHDHDHDHDVEASELSAAVQDHEHDEKAETTLVVVTVIIYVFVAILGLLVFYQCMRSRKGQNGVAYQQD